MSNVISIALLVSEIWLGPGPGADKQAADDAAPSPDSSLPFFPALFTVHTSGRQWPGLRVAKTKTKAQNPKMVKTHIGAYTFAKSRSGKNGLPL